jgi:trans-2,3-dihydro-3-hydroxyanthranilate isomerase
MTTYHFRIVNVFAETMFGGNPLCVFEHATGMSDMTMQLLARQFNLAETTFLLPSPCADAKVRIFTPAQEMRFAGHPVLGSAHVVRDLISKTDDLKLELQAGTVAVTAHQDVWTFAAPSTSAPSIRAPDLSPDVIARIVGLTADDLLSDPLWVDTGADQLLIPVKTCGAVRRAAPAADLLSLWPVNSQGRKTAYVFAFDEERGPANKVVSRYFHSAQGGIGEDPGTGSACANLGGWLIATNGPVPAHIEIIQGESIARPCRLLLDVTKDHAIHVGGRVIEIGRGTVNV